MFLSGSSNLSINIVTGKRERERGRGEGKGRRDGIWGEGRNSESYNLKALTVSAGSA